MNSVSVEGYLGIRAENTIDALKKQLGVSQLELVVMSSVDEYYELLVEKPQDRRWSWRKRLVVAVLTFVLASTFAGVFHPGVRIDHLIKPWDYLGVH